jgi:diguanylate cyclase (GGDEF)-like protein
MKRLLPIFAILFACATIAWAAPPAPLTSLRAIHSVTNAEANKGLPVAFEATATYFVKVQSVLFVQDGGDAIYVSPNTEKVLLPGDRVLIKGKTHGSFHPIVVADSITLLHHGDLPKPIPATYDQLIRGQYDCLLVTMRGIVRSADKSNLFDSTNAAYIQMLTDGGYVSVLSDVSTAQEREDLLDAEVEVTGVAGGQFDGKMQMHGVQLNVALPENVKILHRAGATPWSLPLTPMDLVISRYHVTDRTQRVRVHGTITYYQPGSSVVLQNGKRSLWISTLTVDPMRVGDVIDATGFPEAHNGFLALTHGEFLGSQVHAPVTPLPTTRKELSGSQHIIDLVSLEAQVVTEAREGAQDEYYLTADGQLFTAIYRHPYENTPIPPMKQIPVGSRVRVTGICITEDSNPFHGQVPFDILMRSYDDIAVVAGPPLVNTRNLMILAGLLLVAIIIVGIRGWALEHKVRRQTAAMALIEQQRSRVLEDINGARPLAEILEEITELVSFQLKGAPCWCEVTDGARLGNCPPQLASLRIVREPISARSGPPLGELSAAFDPHVKPSATEPEALSKAVRLATLAIETRRLYSDLLHRSEFDLLTDIHNRFSLEKLMDAQIEEARLKATVFGLIYIDLDDFKQVNDSYGHQVGDQYLQEVTLRMKRQLRPHDKLARLGGDEFAALVPLVRSRSEVEEIAQRLERCFDEPFDLEGLALTGSASVGIALYPENGAKRDDLLNAADAAMYVAKNAKRQIEKSLSQSLHSEITDEIRA